MTQARKNLININDTPYYHCMGRCVRRAFLCGVDEFSGNDYSHRKQWIVDKLTELSDVFMIDVCAYAVMSNHYHLVLKINHEATQQLSDKAVIERWMRLFKGNVLIERYLSGSCQEGAERVKVNEIVALWRERLSDISWFMRCLNESIALKANQEDQCTGRFWEGRFKSQALLNEQALLSCMAYVDLNPVRAGIAESLDSSDFTSIEQRIREIQSAMDDCDNDVSKDDKEACGFLKLAIFVDSKDKAGIPFTFKDYLELTDWTGRTIRENKTGFISDKQPRMLDKLGLDSETWFKVLNQYSDRLYSHLGTEQQLKSVCHESGKKWLAGIKSCRQLFSD